MKDEDGSKGFMFALFCFIVIIHNSLAPSDIRQELNDYSIKFYGVTLMLGLGYVLYRIFIKGEK